MLLREFIGGDPPDSYKLIFRDDPTGFGHRVTDGERMVERVLTNRVDFEQAESELTAAGSRSPNDLSAGVSSSTTTVGVDELRP